MYESGQHSTRHRATENDAVRQTTTTLPQRSQRAQRTDMLKPFHELFSVTSGVKGRGSRAAYRQDERLRRDP